MVRQVESMSKRITITMIALLMALLLGLGLYVSVKAQAHQEQIRVREIRTYKFVTPSWCFVFEDFNNPELAKLIERENLKGLVKGAETEFEQVLLVKKWVQEQLKKAGNEAPGIILEGYGDFGPGPGQ